MNFLKVTSIIGAMATLVSVNALAQDQTHTNPYITKDRAANAAV